MVVMVIERVHGRRKEHHEEDGQGSAAKHAGARATDMPREFRRKTRTSGEITNARSQREPNTHPHPRLSRDAPCPVLRQPVARTLGLARRARAGPLVFKGFHRGTTHAAPPRAMASPPVLCLSHVPWAHGLERPHQVMRRLARDREVFFVEEPRVTKGEQFTVMRTVEPNLHVVTLRVPSDMSARAVEHAQRRVVASLAARADHPLLWVYSPVASRAARDVEPSLVVYDCVADHAASENVSPDAKESELALLARADLVLTAGTSLFDAKRAYNVSTYPLPSSVDAAHFAGGRRARGRAKDLSKLGAIPGPRVGFLGPVDDRVDLDLVDRLAAERPSLHIILLGALVGITKWALPDRSNVHFIGGKDYEDLPDHVASWDAAIFPFRSDVATRRTEPSGLLGCLAAGKTIVSTPLDEIAPYVANDLVTVADAEHFVPAVDAALRQARNPIWLNARRRTREAMLARTSWDRTCSAMFRLVDEAVMARAVRGSSRDECGRQTSFEGSGPPFVAAPDVRQARFQAN